MNCVEFLSKLLAAIEQEEKKVPTPKPTPKPEDWSPWVPDKYEEHYFRLWNGLEIRPGTGYKGRTYASMVGWYVNGVKRDESRYRSIAGEFEIPWQVVGIINGLECGFSFKKYLGNGQAIIGNGKKSTWVPKGRGPFATWEQGARDALQNDKVKAVPNWTLTETLYFFERYNGMGYWGKKDKFGEPVYSPYLWGLSNRHLYGKYVSDGVYSPSAITAQAGAALIMKQLGMFK